MTENDVSTALRFQVRAWQTMLKHRMVKFFYQISVSNSLICLQTLNTENAAIVLVQMLKR
jgi:hypothetical protein